MAIDFVGSLAGSAIDGGGVTVSLTALAGGIDASVNTDDVVYAITSSAGSGASGMSSAGWTQVDVASLAYAKVWRKVMGGTPDTSVVSTGSGNATHGTAMAVIAFRGVDTTTPEDVAVVNTTGLNPAAVTSVTDGCMIAVLGRVANSTTPVAPSGYSGLAHAAGDDTSDTSAAVAYKAQVTAGSEDPGAWTGWTNTQGVVFTVAVRPAGAGGAASLTLPLIASGLTLYAPTLVPGAVSLALPLIASGAALYSPSLVQILALPAIASTATLYAPSLAVGAVDFTLPLLANSNTLYSPTLVPGAVTLDLPLIASAAALYAPTLASQAVIITLPLIASSAALYAPTLDAGEAVTTAGYWFRRRRRP